jgi:hypothetical protein
MSENSCSNKNCTAKGLHYVQNVECKNMLGDQTADYEYDASRGGLLCSYCMGWITSRILFDRDTLLNPYNARKFDKNFYFSFGKYTFNL